MDEGIEHMEQVLVHNMDWVGDRAMDWPDGSRDVQVYEVEANGEIEATVWGLLDEAYGGKEPEVNRRQHSQIVIINPSKLRMKSMLPPAGGNKNTHVDGGHADAVQAQRERAAAEVDFLEAWKKGMMTSAHVVEQEAGFLYRYRYGGRGGGAAFVGQYNFLLIDISAGPVSYGPLASPSGAVTPTAMPRLMPMLLRMTRELETHPQPGTLRQFMLEEAARGQAAVFAGQLASTVAAATRHLFASDLMMAAADGLGAGEGGMPKRVVVPIIVMQDHVRELEHEGDGTRWIDTDMIQLALDEMLPPEVAGSVSVSRHMLHHHKLLASALVKARHSRSDTVLLQPPDVGLHKSQVTSLDSALLLRELRLAAADDDLMGGLVDVVGGDDYHARWSYSEDPDAFLAKRKRETKVLPVFVFSLERAPEHLMFDNHQLVAAASDVVAVLQLLGSPLSDENNPRGRTYSGHMAESHHLMLDAAEQPSRSVIGGLATALGGMVPVQQRYCRAERALVEDWRWSVGAVPWGPYSNYTALSSVFAATARRNLLVARIERPLRKLISSLNKLDDFIVKHLQGPFAYLRRRKSGVAMPVYAPAAATYGEGTPAPLYHNMPNHHLLDDLARLHIRYHNGSSAVHSAKRIVRHLMAGMKMNPGSKANNDSTSTTSEAHHNHHRQQVQQPQPPPHHRGRHLQGFESPQHDDVDGHGFPGQHDSYNHHSGDENNHQHYQFHYEHHYENGEHHFTEGGEYDPNAYDHPALLSEEEVTARTANAAAGGRDSSSSANHGGVNRADLLEEQQALTPDVALRLQTALDSIGSQLESISYLMFNRNWAELEDLLAPFYVAVNLFAAAVDQDLHHASEVVACCAVRHVPTGSGTWFVVGLVVTLLGVFGIIAALAIRSQKLYGSMLVGSPRGGLGSSGGGVYGGVDACPAEGGIRPSMDLFGDGPTDLRGGSGGDGDSDSNGGVLAGARAK
ncbi:hypothetical protein VOLCADRAFT_90382 [Volvox carteri f. nagariensis]|uniref:DUF7906 domain-containing protein n=1 Tax=Volvox carteri f. nagariensis TaxID=3068 RepID=D8TU82_VOLCA|nr:uncharacterized protein VOLCADRAFT_90382 [Volvox carteri f. nagariensis]EFJ48990.1 hypothetical protein VOLCADRAFT_90382 [Volvox carteri f. nagariensis]|eukprot:XP_002949887.1 hypothetical protein VOLCADRAFT_90382 [Volvox carteri f. nagariensis]